MQRLLGLVERLSRTQRRELLDKLKAQATATESVELIESAAGHARGCPQCASSTVVRNGLADGLQRYKCRTCGKTFNALTGTPLARLRYKGKWLEQARAMADGLTVHRAAGVTGSSPCHEGSSLMRSPVLPRLTRPTCWSPSRGARSWVGRRASAVVALPSGACPESRFR